MAYSSLFTIFFCAMISLDRCEVNDLCKDTNYMPEIKDAALVDNDLFILAKGKDLETNLYFVEDIVHDSSDRFDFKHIRKKIGLPEWFQQVKLLYTVYVPSKAVTPDAGRIRLVAIRYHKKYEYRWLLSGYVISTSETGDFESERPFNISIYEYIPGEDPLNMMSLFNKFPQKDIEKRLKAISTLPLRNRRGLPRRFFVYYLDLPINPETLAPGEDDEDFKRHILIEEEIDFGDIKEMNWAYDEKSGKCVESADADAVVTISDGYNLKVSAGPKGQDINYYFDQIRFLKNQYFIERVTLSLEAVLNETQVLKTGTTDQLFRCETNKITSTRTTTTTRPHTRTVTIPSDSNRTIASITTFISIFLISLTF